MVKRVKRRDSDPPAATLHGAVYAPLLDAGLQSAATRIQEMHQAIAAKTFDPLQRVPGLAMPTRIVQGVHDAISSGVYAAVRHGGGALMSMAGHAERIATGPGREPRGKERVLRNVLNGVAGDALADAGSPLAIAMGFHADGRALAPEPAACARLNERTAVFIHGLACDEHSWLLPTDAWAASPWAATLPASQRMHYGALLETELGISAVFVRYNTGLPIAENAVELAAQLERLAQVAPQVREFVLVGHSMGGLVARQACELGRAAVAAWSQRVPMLICLGSPHHGAPLEKIGQLTSLALGLSDVTKPIGQLGDTRSQGIKDLRHGLKKHGKGTTAPAEAPRGMALRFVAGSLGDEGDGAMGKLVGSVLGDGLVRRGSAVDDGLQGDVERVELAGLGHMALLNHPRVYAELRRWLGAPRLA